MSVDTRHPEYSENVNRWAKIKDAIAGEDAIKAAGQAYLPRLSLQEDPEYQAYKNRALFYNATSRTVSGMTGMVVRKKPDINAGNLPDEVITSFGVNGEHIDKVAAEAINKDIGFGRLGMYLDAAELANRPYVSIYDTSAIINWDEQVINGQLELTMVVLEEQVPKEDRDEFSHDTKTRWRVLKLVEIEGEEVSYVHIVELWEKKKDSAGKEQFIKVEEFVPQMAGGRSYDFIPFTFVGTTSTTASVELSPILDLVNVNLSHYRTSADLEHGQHYVALPTPYALGFPKTSQLVVGANTAWVTEEHQAQVGMLEFTGAGLGRLAKSLEEKQVLMSVLGARLLEEQKKGVEAQETVKMRHAGDQSILANITDTVSEAMTKLMRWTALWLNASSNLEQIHYKLQKDFNTAKAQPQQVTSWTAALQSGAMSFETYFYNMKQGEMYEDGWTMEDELDAIAARGGIAGMPLDPGQSEETQQDELQEEEETQEEVE